VCLVSWVILVVEPVVIEKYFFFIYLSICFLHHQEVFYYWLIDPYRKTNHSLSYVFIDGAEKYYQQASLSI
jgi:hypothetical protein